MKPHSNMSYFIRNLGPVDTYPNIYDNGDFFSVLAFCPPVNSVFRHLKPRFSKAAPRVELFSESPAYRLCEQTRIEFFEYNDVIHHIAHALLMMLSYFFVFFFLITEKKESPFSKISGYLWTRHY